MARAGKRPEGEGKPPLRTGRLGIPYLPPVHAAAFLNLVRAADHLERTLDAELRRGHGIGLRGFEVLLHLGAFSPDGRLPMVQLNRQAPLSQSRMSRLVTELERERLVSREPDEHDTRAVAVTITDQGLDRLREAGETHYSGLQRHLFSRLTREELAELARLTDKLVVDRPGPRP